VSKVYEGGDSAADLIEDAGDADAAMGGKAKPIGGGEDDDPVTAFLTRVPPDWDLAEAHAKANLVLNNENTVLNPDDPSSYCPCCQMPYPKDEDFCDLYVDNARLGVLGPGFPLFFILMQYLIYYLAGLCVVYFLPVYFSISSSIEALESHGYFVESKIAMLSYGAYVVGADHYHEDKVGFTK